MNRRDLYKFVEFKKLLKEDEELKIEEDFGFFAEYLTDDLAYK